MIEKLDPNQPIFISEDNSKIENIMPANNRHFSLPELYKMLLTEMVQVVELYDGKIMIIDEEGKLKDEPVINKLATELYSVDRMNETDWKNTLEDYEKAGFVIVGISDSELGLPHNSICGNVIICQNKFFK